MPDISAIIVNWNTRDLLTQCLASLQDQVGGLALQVIVVDNNSTDGSVRAVRELFPGVELVANTRNYGFARANNMAFPLTTGRYIWLLNPDTIVCPGAPETLTAVLDALPQLAAVGAQLSYPDGSPQASAGEFPALGRELPLVRRLLHSRGHRRKLPAPAALGEVSAVDWAKGASLMLRRDALDDVGPLDEDYWLYTEEVDWCYRARRAGWQIALATTAHVVHFEQAASRQRPAETLVQFVHSRALYYKRHGRSGTAFLFRCLSTLRALLWLARPQHSPLGRGKNDLTRDEIRTAYRALYRDCLSWRWPRRGPQPTGSETCSEKRRKQAC